MEDNRQVLSHRHRSLILSMYLLLAIGLGLLPYAWFESRLNQARATAIKIKPASEPEPTQPILMFPIRSASPSAGL